MNIKKIKEEQKEIIKNIFDSKFKSSKIKLTFLKKIISIKDNVLFYSLGSVGEKLKNFAKLVDLEHPDLVSLFDGQLVGNKVNTFSKRAIDNINVVEYCLKNNVSIDFLIEITSYINNFEIIKNIEKIIDSPVKNKLNIRFLKCEKKRQKIRKYKKNQIINQYFITKNEFLKYEKIKKSLIQFSRKNNEYLDNIKQIENMKKTLLEVGLQEMSVNINEKINIKLKEIENFKYFGFNKIEINNITLNLAKLCKLNFKNNFFYFKNNINFPILSDKKEFKVIFKLYNIHEIKDIASPDVINIVNFCEKFPELGNKSLFDYYRIIVPTVDFPMEINKNNYFYFKNKNNKVICFKDKQKAERYLDCQILKTQNTVGALIGERNGENYFISYFI